MRRTSIIIAVVAAAIAGLLLVTFLLLATFLPAGVSVRSSSVGDGVSAMDLRFIEEMVPHHQDAVDMAELALSKAEHPELKQLAETIRRDQSREIESMRSWYRSWTGTELSDGSSRMGAMMGSDLDLDKLAQATSFDREFIEHMVPHHEMALMMVHMIRSSGRPEMRALAEDIVRTQSAEIEQMRRWYEEWYGLSA